MTPAQLAALKADIQNNPTLTALLAAGEIGQVVAHYNAPASPAFYIWRDDVSAAETGNAWSGSDIDGMSSLNMQRLQLLLASSPGGTFDMSRADRRAGFENPFGTNVNNPSRVAMRAVWKRTTNNVEKLFATGTGSDADPAVLTFKGTISQADIEYAMAS